MLIVKVLQEDITLAMIITIESNKKHLMSDDGGVMSYD